MILIIGGMGFIGLNTALHLLEVGEPVVITQPSSHRLPDPLKDDVGTRVFTARMDVTVEDLSCIKADVGYEPEYTIETG